MSRYRVNIDPRADAEALEGFRYLADRSPAMARRWLDGLKAAVAKLAVAPERYPIAEEESERFGLPIRQLLYGRRRGVYRILYTIERDRVTVLHIRHSARGPVE